MAKQDSISLPVKQGDDRNIMLNAESANAGPRNVNIGLPASVEEPPYWRTVFQ